MCADAECTQNWEGPHPMSIKRWLIRFVTAITGAAITGWWLESWVNEGGSLQPHDSGWYWQSVMAPLLLRSGILIFFLIWSLQLLIELRVRSALGSTADLHDTEREATGRHMIRIRVWSLVTVFLLMIPFHWIVDRAADTFASTNATAIREIGNWLSLSILFISTLWALRAPSRVKSIPAEVATNGKSAEKNPQRMPGLAQVFSWLLTIGILIVPLNLHSKVLLAGVVFLLSLGLSAIPLRMGQWALTAVYQGTPQEALRRVSLCSWFPGYPKAVEALSLLEAGRYNEAQELLRPIVFVAGDKPQVSCPEFYVYALALSNSGDEQTAERLLEEAVLVAPRPGVIRFPKGTLPTALACCLLAQNKDTERAEQIIRDVLAESQKAGLTAQMSATLAHRTAIHAWALACCGQAGEAKIELEDAFTRLANGSQRDMATMHYTAGKTWQHLGELKKARAAFESSLSLFSDGDIGIRTQRALTKLQELSQG